MDEQKKLDDIVVEAQSEEQTLVPANEPEKKGKKKKEKKDNKVLNMVFTILQIVLVVVCVVISINVIINPSNGLFKDEDSAKEGFKGGLTLILSDSMAPTYNVNDYIWSSKLAKDSKISSDSNPEILPIGTNVSYFSTIGTIQGIITHRIIGYRYTDKDTNTENLFYYCNGVDMTFADYANGRNFEFTGYVTSGDHYNLARHYLYGGTMTYINQDFRYTEFVGAEEIYDYDENGKLYSLKEKYQSMDDLKFDYRVYGVKMTTDEEGKSVPERVDGHLVIDRDNEITTPSARNADSKVLQPHQILATVNGNFRLRVIGNVIAWLIDQDHTWRFAVVIVVPLGLLFGYNVYLIIRMIIDDKQKKAKEEARKEVMRDEDEIKRKAVEEYLASLKEKEAAPADNKDEN